MRPGPAPGYLAVNLYLQLTGERETVAMATDFLGMGEAAAMVTDIPGSRATACPPGDAERRPGRGLWRHLGVRGKFPSRPGRPSALLWGCPCPERLPHGAGDRLGHGQRFSAPEGRVQGCRHGSGDGWGESGTPSRS